MLGEVQDDKPRIAKNLRLRRNVSVYPRGARSKLCLTFVGHCLAAAGRLERSPCTGDGCSCPPPELGRFWCDLALQWPPLSRFQLGVGEVFVLTCAITDMSHESANSQRANVCWHRYTSRPARPRRDLDNVATSAGPGAPSFAPGVWRVWGGEVSQCTPSISSNNTQQ